MINDLKKALLAGVGTMATVCEKADIFINDMVEKGKITVEDGKELSEELKRNIVEKTGEAAKSVSMKLDEIKPLTKEEIKVIFSESNEKNLKEIFELKERIIELEKKVNDKE